MYQVEMKENLLKHGLKSSKKIDNGNLVRYLGTRDHILLLRINFLIENSLYLE